MTSKMQTRFLKKICVFFKNTFANFCNETCKATKFKKYTFCVNLLKKKILFNQLTCGVGAGVDRG